MNTERAIDSEAESTLSKCTRCPLERNVNRQHPNRTQGALQKIMFGATVCNVRTAYVDSSDRLSDRQNRSPPKPSRLFFSPISIFTGQEGRDNPMSQAFVREGDEQSLSDIAPTLNALMRLLTYENGGIRVYEKKQSTNADGREIHSMSNGLSYTKDENGKWCVV